MIEHWVIAGQFVVIIAGVFVYHWRHTDKEDQLECGKRDRDRAYWNGVKDGREDMKRFYEKLLQRWFSDQFAEKPPDD